MPGAKPANHSDFSGLRALAINCTLKTSPTPSHTDKVLALVLKIMRDQGVAVEEVRAVDHEIAPGVQPDMTEHGLDRDDWPAIWKKVAAADILILGTPIWLGDMSSVCRRVIERLYAHSGQTNDKGQYVFYGKAGGCIVDGNEDGMKHVARDVLYSLQHIGYTIPPQADAGWVGEAGPGESYGDECEDGSRAGFDNDFTRKGTTLVAWNLMHMARMLKDAGGLPNYGNSVEDWENGERFGAVDPAELLA